MSTRRTRLTPIGLDIGPRGVRAAQLRLDAAGLARAARLASLTRGAGPDGLDGAGAESIVEALARQGFEGSDLVLAVPAERLLSAVLEVPARSSGAPLDAICRNELARAYRLEAAEIESAWWELPPPVGQREVEGAQAMALGCRTADAERMIGAFELAGASVVAIDARGPALMRAALCGRSDPLAAVLEIEAESSLIVVARAGVIVYERHLPEAGLDATRAELVRRLSVEPDVADHLLGHAGLVPAPGELADDPELVEQAQRLIGERLDSLALELRASVSYASRRFGESACRVALAGQGAAVPGLPARLEKRLEAAAEVLVPACAPPPPPVGGPESSLPAMSASIGLALHPPEAHA